MEETANIGDTIEWTFPSNSPDALNAGKTFRETVERVNHEIGYYVVSASYGADTVSFEDATIIEN